MCTNNYNRTNAIKKKSYKVRWESRNESNNLFLCVGGGCRKIQEIRKSSELRMDSAWVMKDE